MRKSESSKVTLNIHQRRYLLDRIGSLRYRGEFREPQAPADVKQARTVMKRWERHLTKLRQSYERQRAVRFAKARKLLNFGTPAEALAAVEALEDLP